MRRTLRFVLLLVVLIAASAYFLADDSSPKAIQFPNGKRFAFSIIDDTDMTTLERVKPVYEVLQKYGVRTTKTVWVMESNDESHSTNKGDSLRNPSYREFVLDLQNKGFEIALHGVRGGSSQREEILKGLEEFKQIVGHYPRMHINHSQNRDNIYWGKHVLSMAPYRWVGGLAMPGDFHGHEPGSQYFWGDLAKQHVSYVRRFTFPGINLLAVNPSFPYRLADKPYVNYWFPTANGDRVIEFNELLKSENLDRLAQQGGVCLVYAHLGSGSFTKQGTADPRFEARIKDLASRDGWFVPASEILDYLKQQPGWTGDIGSVEKFRLESKFILGQVLSSIF